MRPLKKTVIVVSACLMLGVGACTVYVVPAEEAGSAGESVAEAEEPAQEEAENAGQTGDTDRPPERQVRRRDGSESSDSAAAVAEQEARVEAERQAREEAERQAREEAERQAREEAERQARIEAEREARLAAEQRARREAERRAREAEEREARLAEEQERERAAREARAAREREERLAAEREARAEAERLAAAEATREAEERARHEARARARAGSRELHVPPGHHPPEGQCRIWYEGRPPGRQPAPAPCEELMESELEPGIFILYGGESWDGNHDWEGVDVEYPGAVPRPVVALSRVVAAEMEDDAPGSRSAEREAPSRGSSNSVTESEKSVVDPSADGPRRIEIPRGQLPPEGECRIWYEGRPPGRQPAAAPCSELGGVETGADAFVVFRDDVWDATYDWSRREAEEPGSVPLQVLEVLSRDDGEGIEDDSSPTEERPGPRRRRGGDGRP